MGKTLIIVESPAKCKKIESYLGNNYKVIASCEHFTKLDSLDQINFKNYNIKYKIDKAKVLKQMKMKYLKQMKSLLVQTMTEKARQLDGLFVYFVN